MHSLVRANITYLDNSIPSHRMHPEMLYTYGSSTAHIWEWTSVDAEHEMSSTGQTWLPRLKTQSPTAQHVPCANATTSNNHFCRILHTRDSGKEWVPTFVS